MLSYILLLIFAISIQSSLNCLHPHQCKIYNCYCCSNYQNICLECDQNYHLSSDNSSNHTDNSCVLIEQSNTGIKYEFIIGIILLIFCWICCMSTIIYYSCRRCKRNYYSSRNENLNNNVEMIFPTQTIILKEDEQQFKYDNENDRCTICLQNNCDTITYCNHYFHYECLNKWIKKYKYCPVCKNKRILNVKFVCCMKCQNRKKQKFYHCRQCEISNQGIGSSLHVQP